MGQKAVQKKVRKEKQGTVKTASENAVNVKSDNSDNLSQVEVLKLYLSQAESEWTLLNARTTWFLTTQGFLFAAFAVFSSRPCANINWMALFVVPAFGFFASVTSQIGISMAYRTLIEWNNAARAHISDCFSGQNLYIPKRFSVSAERDIVQKLSFLLPNTLGWLTAVLWLALSVLSVEFPLGFK